MFGKTGIYKYSKAPEGGHESGVYRSRKCEKSGELIKDLKDAPTIYKLTKNAVDKFGEKQCFGRRYVLETTEETNDKGKLMEYPVLSEYKWFTYKEFYEKVKAIGSGLASLGLISGAKVALFAATSPFWASIAQGTNITFIYYRLLYAESNCRDGIRYIGRGRLAICLIRRQDFDHLYHP